MIAYTVTRRTSEIGVRLALGATRSDVAHVILRETTLLLVLGVCAGIVLALLGGRAAHALLFNVTSHDPLILAAAIVGTRSSHWRQATALSGAPYGSNPSSPSERNRRASLVPSLPAPGSDHRGSWGLISIFYRFLEQNSPSGDTD